MDKLQPGPVTKGTYPKYRIWDEDKRKFYFSGETLIIRKDGKSLVAPFAIPIDYDVKKDFIVTLTEFTGILDSSSKQSPIYTGDIIVLKKNGISSGQGIAQWLPHVASYNVSIDLMNGHQMEVIGNIFENKELVQEIERAKLKPQLDLSGNISKALIDTKKLPN